MDCIGSYRCSVIHVLLIVLFSSILNIGRGKVTPPQEPIVTLETLNETSTAPATPGIPTYPLQVYGTIKSKGCWTSIGECPIPTAFSEFHGASVNISLNQPASIFEDNLEGELMFEDDNYFSWYVWEFTNYSRFDISVIFWHCDSTSLSGTCSWKIDFKTTVITSPPKFGTSTSYSTSANTLTSFLNITKTPKNLSPQTPTITTIMACMCPCVCNTTPISQDRMETMMKEIKEDMALNVTSQEKRRLVSASDKRLISRGIGYVGVLFMTIVFGVILIGDAKLLVHDTRAALRNFSGK